MAASREIEIKFNVSDLEHLQTQLQELSFRCVTPSTHESNTLYDLPQHELRTKGQLLRLRRFGQKWILTHKARASAGRFKSRVELETEVADGKVTDAILRKLGYEAVFAYEKFRSEWSDGTGHVVLDRTPIGDIAEIEGPASWIDRTAKRLGVTPDKYIRKSYAELFTEWNRRYKRKAKNMTFRECGGRAKSRSASLRSSAEAEAGSGL